MKPTGTLYLLPVGLGESPLEDVLPQRNIQIVKTLTHFIAENAKEGRAFLKQNNYPNISVAEFSEINKHTKKEELVEFLAPLLNGNDMGLMSDAGCPGIADPGADIISIAHQKNIKVVPLVGPSSIVLSIMASGFNGQNFAFNGYLPIKTEERQKRMRELYNLVTKNNQAQFFIETPYRNQNLFEDALKALAPTAKLLVATNLTLSEEYISVKTIAQWKKEATPDFFKKPTVFGIYQ
jgi:16S rRNA (cytidine1402-2'-O)-methyltransferase